MANHEKEESSDISSVGIAVGISFLLCLSVLGYFFTNQTKVSDDAFAFQPLVIDNARLEAERKSRLGDKVFDLKDPRIIGLLSVARMTNAEQFSTLLTDTEKIRREAERVHRANEVLEQGWFPAFWTVGEILLKDCKKELARVVTQIQKGADPANFRSSKDYIDYRESCGDILPVLFERNILSKRGQWIDPKGPEIVDLTLRYSWGFILADRRHPSRQLTPYEYELYETWRIGNEKGFTREERLKFLMRAKSRIEGFPANLLMAKMQFQAGKKQSALKLLQEAEKESGDAEIGRLKRYLEKSLKKP